MFISNGSTLNTRGLSRCSFLLGVLLTVQVSTASGNSVTSSDPTKPPQLSTSSQQNQGLNSEIKLSAIFTKRDNRFAVLNDTIVTVNDVVARYRVIQINDQSVTLADTLDNGKLVIIRLFSDTNIKKQVKK